MPETMAKLAALRRRRDQPDFVDGRVVPPRRDWRTPDAIKLETQVLELGDCIQLMERAHDMLGVRHHEETCQVLRHGMARLRAAAADLAEEARERRAEVREP